jgi:uncharacterized protein YkwD
VRSTRSAVRSVVTVLAVVVALSSGLVGVTPASATTGREARMVARINHAREVHGLPPLQTSPDLVRAARTHSGQMAGQRTLFHTPSFSGICCWGAVGENIGMGYTVRSLHQAFMHSPPHRANILDPRMREVGVGFVSAGGRLWVTEVFRQPAG